ncbi:hypothetical protein B0J17DRAFT_677341 [Rhizoctonia solani]|nr:hypothetical protein B0J17DRAFT_677341 [Rhizoctonia solani]
MNAEVESATSLEVRLSEANTAIEWTRHPFDTHLTVNHLPPEILAHIFYLVVDVQPCANRDYGASISEQGQIYPAALSQACSLWRAIVLNTPTLWSHIDISTSTDLNRLRLNSLVELHLSHISQIPLDLHIFDPKDYVVSSLSSHQSLHELIAKLASRTSSFHLDPGYTYNHDIHGPILSIFFKVVHDHDYNSGFITPEDDPDDDGMGISLPLEQFEAILSGVSILHLDRMFPRWTSRAYHGLVELRLNGTYSSINESDLIGILRSSPDLRILELGLDIDEPLPVDAPVIGIPLNNLEALNLCPLLCKNLAILLRWLAPGPNPLQFAVQQGTYENLEVKESLGSFFVRSEVTRAYGKGLDFSLIIELLALSPKVQKLVISCAQFDSSGPLRREDIASTVLNCQLEYLCMIHSSVHMENILALISTPAFIVKTVALHWCTFFRDGARVPRDQEDSILGELHKSHPQVTFIIRRSEEANPARNWDLFASYDDLHV